MNFECSFYSQKNFIEEKIENAGLRIMVNHYPSKKKDY